MRWLKILLALNGVAYAYYGLSNIALPTSYFLPSDAADYAIATVRVVGVMYVALAIVQLGAWRIADRGAVRLISVASLVAAVGFAVQAALLGSGSTTVFQSVGVAVAAGYAVFAALFAILIYREWREAA